MQITDAIADLLTRIRNANTAKHDTVEVPASNIKKAIVQILLEEGYIKSLSKPGLRIYSDVENMPKVMKGLGVAIISTSKGVMTDRQARKENVGGEVLAYIW